MNKTSFARSFKLSLLATAAVATLSVNVAVAQEAPPAEPTVEKVTVTGSRLKKRDYSTTSPVTTINSQTFELTQTNSVERLLNDLPQLVPGNTFTSNNAGGEEFATIDLRGLGPNRTLILVNGNRLPASSTTGAADINTIPAGLIDRVEVVTGGASAVYGSDAVSGVVNFILKKNFEGFELTASANQAERGLAEERNFQGLIGGNFAGGKGNVTVFAEYFSREGVSQGEFDYSRVAGSYCYSYSTGKYSVVDSKGEAQACVNQDGGGFVSGGGSGTPAWGWIAENPDNPFQNLSAVLPSRFLNVDADCDPSTGAEPSVDGGNLSFDSTGALTPRFTSGACGVPDRGTGLPGNSSRYNYAPDNYLVIPAERYNVSMFGHYDLEENVTFNFGAIYSDSYTQVKLAATPATDLNVTYNAPMQALIASRAPDLALALATRDDPLADFIINRRTNEVGLRVGDSENSSVNLFGSLEGTIDESWSYEVSASFADVDFITRARNSVNKTALAQGLAGCADVNGVPLGSAALPGCVALDIFGADTLTDEMTNFLRVNTWSRTQVEEATASGFLSGDLFDLTGAGPTSLVAGSEYRYSKASFQVDNEQRTGNIFGFNATQDQSGSQDVIEGYTEVSVPLVADVPYVHFLGVEAGFRLSEYSTAGSVETYKYGGEYSPFAWLKFRGVYNKATRVASVFEAFQDGDQGFPSYTDPCRDTNGDGTLNDDSVDRSFCETRGVIYDPLTGIFVANNSQVEAFAFGNADLSPETAETTTIGVVLQTGNDWFGIGNLRASVDRYEIEISDVIAEFGAQFFINQCYQDNTDVANCANVVRDPVTGQIDFVNTSRGNQGTLSTEGYDIQIDYRLDLDDIGLDGILSINELFSFVDTYSINGDNYAGTTSAGIGGATFDWKSSLSVQYAIDDWTVFSRWSYVPELTEQDWAGDPKAPAASYVDVALRYAPVEWLNLTVTVNNVADEETPQTLNGLFDQANTDAALYDPLGRTWALSIRTKM